MAPDQPCFPSQELQDFIEVERIESLSNFSDLKAELIKGFKKDIFGKVKSIELNDSTINLLRYLRWPKEHILETLYITCSDESKIKKLIEDGIEEINLGKVKKIDLSREAVNLLRFLRWPKEHILETLDIRRYYNSDIKKLLEDGIEEITLGKVNKINLSTEAVNLLRFLRWPKEHILETLDIRCDYDFEIKKLVEEINLGKVNKIFLCTEAVNLLRFLRWPKEHILETLHIRCSESNIKNLIEDGIEEINLGKVKRINLREGVNLLRFLKWPKEHILETLDIRCVKELQIIEGDIRCVKESQIKEIIEGDIEEINLGKVETINLEGPAINVLQFLRWPEEHTLRKLIVDAEQEFIDQVKEDIVRKFNEIELKEWRGKQGLEIEKKELENHLDFFWAKPVSSGFRNWKGYIISQDDSPYKGKQLILDIKLPWRYPFKAPEVKFETPIWHPNVDSKTGELSRKLILDYWTPGNTIRVLLLEILTLLSEPNPDCFIDPEVADMYNNRNDEFKKKASEFGIN